MKTPVLIQTLFGEWVTATRAKKGILRKQFVPFGLSESAIKSIEDNHHDVRLTTFINVCYALGEDPLKMLARFIKEAEKS